MIHRDEPTRVEQLQLMNDAELRVERQAWRKESMPPPGPQMRGRRRTVIEDEKTLALSMPAAEIRAESVELLDEAIKDRQPLFDQFTLHYRVRPTHQSIEKYVNSGSNRKGIGGKSLGPKPLSEYPADERPKIVKARQRQWAYLSDNLQRETFDDRNIARARRYSLMATQYFIRSGMALDPDAARMAADALVDFGHTLNDKRNTPIRDAVHNHDLGFQIIRIGTLAGENPELLAENQSLMQLVQREQRKREEFWGKIYDASKDYFDKTRLVNANREAGNALQAELERLAAICPPVQANLPKEPIIGEYESKKAA
jgi:hypothetical protein